jgi:hypothetical protein
VKHPGIVVDEQRRGPDHPRRLPLALHRPLVFSVDGVSLLAGAERVHGTLDAELKLRTRDREEAVAPGVQFHVHRHPYRVETGDELLVDVRRIGELVVFNCWHSAENDVRWRGFRVDDVNRSLGDVVVRRGLPAQAPSTSGVPLSAVVAATVAQGASMEPAVAASLVQPIVDGGALLDVVVSWDGHSISVRRGTVRARRTVDREALEVYAKLAGASADLKSVERASAALVGDVVRALFPEAWAIERAVREQAAMLDVDALA